MCLKSHQQASKQQEIARSQRSRNVLKTAVRRGCMFHIGTLHYYSLAGGRRRYWLLNAVQCYRVGWGRAVCGRLHHSILTRCVFHSSTTPFHTVNSFARPSPNVPPRESGFHTGFSGARMISQQRRIHHQCSCVFHFLEEKSCNNFSSFVVSWS